MNARLVLLCTVLLPSCAAPTAQQRAEVYQANVKLSQATCVAMLTDKEVPHTQAIEDWCRLVLEGNDGCLPP